MFFEVIVLGEFVLGCLFVCLFVTSMHGNIYIRSGENKLVSAGDPFRGHLQAPKARQISERKVRQSIMKLQSHCAIFFVSECQD